MIKIANYDKYDYDYSKYWTNRPYEHRAESYLINRLLKDVKGERFIDIGGSYGRLIDTYKDHYSQCVIVDYSLKTLTKYQNAIKNRAPNITLIAANAYNLPFKDNSFDGGMMIRVLHHISDLETYVNELHRIMSYNSLFLQEFANKIHIKARIRSLFSLDFSQWNVKPYQQPPHGSAEGTNGEQTVFLNYHPKHIKRFFQNPFNIVLDKNGCSFLRSNTIKRLLSIDQMMKLEKFLQKTLGKTNIPPSIVYTVRAMKDPSKTVVLGSVNDIIVCPKCKGNMDLIQHKYHCKECKLSFSQKNNIWDFRI